MPRARYRSRAPVLTSSTWIRATIKPAYLIAPRASMNVRRTTKSVFRGFGSTFEQRLVFYLYSVCVKNKTNININHVSGAMVKETVPTEQMRSKVSAPRDIAVEEHFSAPTGTVRRRPQFVMVSMTAVTVLTRKIANYRARVSSSNAVQTDGVYWIRGSAMANRTVKTVATKTRRCAVSAFKS